MEGTDRDGLKMDHGYNPDFQNQLGTVLDFWTLFVLLIESEAILKGEQGISEKWSRLASLF
jgi:hypothetical protein